MGTEPPLSQLDLGRVAASLRRRQWAAPAAALALLLLATGILLYFFQQLPIEGTSLGIDWRGLWVGLRANPPVFGNSTGLRIAPWDVLLVRPVAWLPFRASWGLLTLLTLAALVISVPNTLGKKRLWIGCLLLVTAFPAMRHFADGNFEGLIIAGLLLTVYAYQAQKTWLLAAGLLLITAKVQEAWVLCPVLGFYLLRTWPRRHLTLLGGILDTVVILCLIWQGREWVTGVSSILHRGTLVDSSLWATLTRLGSPAWGVALAWLALASLVALYAWRSGPVLTRQKAAALVAAALLLSPYAAGNSYLTVLAIGIIPLVISGNPLAVVLLVLADLPYFANHYLLYYWSANYWTLMLLVSFGALAVNAWQTQKQPSAQLAVEPSSP